MPALRQGFRRARNANRRGSERHAANVTRRSPGELAWPAIAAPSKRCARLPAVLVATLTLLVAGCGKGDRVAVRRPVKPIWVCLNRLSPKRGCADQFNAGLLVGMKLEAAGRLAKAHGYEVRRVAPLADHEGLIMDYESSRLDVETDGTSEHSTVVRFAEQG
jgi:hypothetical protein